MACFADVNVMLAILHERHAFSMSAHQWLSTQGEAGSVAICRVVQMALLRLSTRPSVMKDDVISAQDFWEGWGVLKRDDRFSLVDEPTGLEKMWRGLCAGIPRGQCAETDVYLAAFAMARGDTLVTFDAGFSRFDSLQCEVLRP